MYWIAASLIASLIWVIARAEKPTATPGNGAQPRLIIIGDSQACGATGVANPCGSDPSRLCAKSGETFADIVEVGGTKAIVYCKVGAHTSEWAAAVPSLGLKQGDVVLVFLGSNDYNAKPDPTPLVNAIKATGASYLWVGPPAIRGQVGVAPAYLASKLGAAYFDSRTLSLKLADGIHPTPSEFARWMTAVLAIVQKQKDSRVTST
jgi:hypothetical protein